MPCTCFVDDVQGPMVKCSSHDCPFGQWFHIQCIGLEALPSTLEDWYCSTECKETKQSEFCKCKKQRDEDGQPVILCALGAECEGGMKFHLDCVNLETVPGWFDTIILFLPPASGINVIESFLSVCLCVHWTYIVYHFNWVQSYVVHHLLCCTRCPVGIFLGKLGENSSYCASY